MRILKLAFENLNSLVGKWSIDLTQPEYVSEGIFAITGDTGAGKSTILDAICLALYGATPRLGKITQSTNEIMSRHTGQCTAEVTYEAAGKQYRCNFSQRRARNKPDGRLQAPKQEFIDDRTGDILHSKLTEVGKKVEETTGMDFDRFTKSMLLAQGGFAKFLLANSGERAPILEKITGTKIYSEISRKVHERKSQEEDTLKHLESALEGMEVLGEEELDEVRNALNRVDEKEKDLRYTLEATNARIAWLDNLALLQSRLDALGQEEKTLEEQIIAFAPKQAILDLALKAQQVEPSWVTLDIARKADEKNQRDTAVLTGQIPDLQKGLEDKKKSFDAVAAELARVREEHKRLQKTVTQVRALDVKRHEKSEQLATRRAELEKQQQSAKQTAETITKTEAQLEQTRHQHETVRKQLEEHAADAKLVESLEAILQQVKQLESAQARVSTRKTDIEKARKELAEQTTTWKLAEEGRKKHEQELKRIEAQRSELQKSMEQTLERSAIRTVREQVDALRERSLQLKQALDCAASQAKHKDTLKELTANKNKLVENSSDLQKRGAQSRQSLKNLDEKIQLLETTLELERKVQDLSGHRKSLEDGRQCPLCGATEHPFAQGNVPQASQSQQKLLEARTQKENESRELAELKAEQARLTAGIEQTDKQLAELSVEQDALSGKLTELLSQLELDLEGSRLEEGLRNEEKATSGFLLQKQDRLKEAESLEERIAQLDKQLDLVRGELERAVAQAAETQQKRVRTEQLLENLSNEMRALGVETVELGEALEKRLESFGVNTPLPTDLAPVVENLTHRRQQWQSWMQRRDELDKALTSLTSDLKALTEKNAELESSGRKLSAELERQREELEALNRERKELFESKNPDEEEKKSEDAVQTIEKARDSARESHEEASRNLTTAQNRLNDLRSSLKELEKEKDDARIPFELNLKDAGLEDEESFLRGKRPRVEVDELKARSNELYDSKKSLQTRKQELTQQLDTEKNRALTDLPKETLVSEREALDTQQKTLQEETGALREKLRKNEESRNKQKEQLERIDLQRAELRRWSALHTLIGSADGKKFRNFAQGLTFELMVGHANEKLRKMTERYLLKRSENEPLELNVIDAFQGGEVRTTRNLSGGESFLVSLALALGLSQIASKNVKVDSLFLDEGFATLDEEALDVALTTLSGLHQEGKLIGVISHVAALKERIPTQIQVSKVSGGKSRLDGPGVG